VVVTGGVSGIGKAITDRLREQDFRVAVFDLDGDAAAAAAGPDGLGLAVDVADAGSVAAGFAAVRVALGPVAVLVNNAGIGGGPAAGRCHETPVEVWEQVQAVNTRGPFLCSRAALPDMLAAGYGQIITIASINSLVVLPGRCAYTTSKGGALALAKCLAVDYGPRGVRSNAICPGMVRTPLVAARIDAGAWDLASLIPLGRPAQPAEIAEAVEVLASGRLDYLNGSAWVIDGGWTAL
jgi:NAD(P)-dependent dehydrogenase (short-subunit alcohol dehydrogenase family)